MRVTSKGQVTIPRRIREAVGISPNSDVDFDVEGDVVMLRLRAPADEGRRRVEAMMAHIERLRENPPRMIMTADEIMELTRGE